MLTLYPVKPKEIFIEGHLIDDLSETKQWCCEPKWNGWRAIVITNSNSEIEAYATRTGDKLSYCNLNGLVLPPDSYFDCEWVDRRSQRKNLLVFFGIYKYKNIWLDGNEMLRRKLLEDCFNNNEVQQGTSNIEVQLVTRWFDSFRLHFNNLKEQINDLFPIEGLVLKKLSAPVEMNHSLTKTVNWLKVKW